MTGKDNTEQYEAWNGESGERWTRDPDRRDQILAPAGDALFAAAALRPGERVLDIGCGCGATTLAAARAVGPEGTAIGLDLSRPMLEVARGRGDAGGMTNVDFIDGDAQTHGFSPTFDVAISRFGTMFFADPTAAFANIATALRPGGRLGLATWQPIGVNEWLTLPGAALLPYSATPPADDVGPAMFSLSDPDTITAVLTDAGFVHLTVEPVDLDLPLGADAAEAADYLADAGPSRTLLATIPDRDQTAALDALRTALADHTDRHGVHLAAAIWIITAARPD